MGSNKGFTIIELLVVIGIIAILAGIMYPVLASGRKRANQATCLSNLHQCVVALRIYMDDYETHVPPDDAVARDLLKKMPTCCPNDKEWTNGCTQSFGIPLIGSYAYTRSVPVWIDAPYDQVQSFYECECQAFLADIFHGSEGVPAPLHTEDPMDYYKNQMKLGVPSWRCSIPDKTLFAFADGHAAVTNHDAPSADGKRRTILCWGSVLGLPDAK
ncbi:MAG: type II secretion system protein [Armatimonadota bacterium]